MSKEEFQCDQEEEKMEQVMTAKEIKKKFRPEFQKNYEKYYPVEFFNSINFVRKQCKKCDNYFWNINPDRELCGDSNCVGSYTFIGKKNYMGIDKKFNLAEAWQTFEDAFTTARIPCKKIDRYPVVARWRNDVDFVQAGIYCFQPYCVTGEMDPPANPLICPQFCVRFNDLDNIGLTGRHYSGFVMIGIQVFNYPNDYKFFKEECLEFNYRWLTEFLKIPPEEIVFSEDIWAGGGNMGPCVEYFVHGMEVGNMVFMQYKTFHDGSIEELKIKVIDTGIGLERVAWLINGDSTSYISAFRESYEFLKDKLEVKVDEEVWRKMGPYSTRLDVDECENLEDTWAQISELIGMSKDDIKKAIEPLRDLFIILDHTRSILFLIKDGALPSNVGGGFNLRNLLRRTFSILEKNKWWDKLGLEGYLEIFKYQEKDIGPLYGGFEPYESFDDIIKLEHTRYKTTDNEQKTQLNSLIKKNKGKLTLKEWYTAVTSYGISPDTISEVAKIPIPDNLYYYIDEQRNRVGKAPEQVLYDTSSLNETICMYFDHLKSHNELNNDFKFKAQVEEVFCNVLEDNRRNVLILNKTCFYPTSGGQQNDIGHVLIEGEKYEVVNVEKVGKCVLHILNKELPEDINGKEIEGFVDEARRKLLKSHHTSAHIIFAACRKVLGPHIWQQGAKKTIKYAHLDISHYSSLSKEQEIQIEEEANKIVMNSGNIKKTLEQKDKAEQEFGFRLYQGGVVPGNELRVVNIEGIDVEACCGTHCDKTSEVGWIKIINTKKISDGVVRLFFVAGEKTLEYSKKDTQILNELCDMWSVPQDQLVLQGNKFFKGYKKYQTIIKDQEKKLFDYEIRIISSEQNKNLLVKSNEANPSSYFSYLAAYADQFKQQGKNLIFFSDSFYFALFTDPSKVDEKKLKEKYGKNIKVMNKLKKVGGLSVISVTQAVKLDEIRGDFEGVEFTEFK